TREQRAPRLVRLGGEGRVNRGKQRVCDSPVDEGAHARQHDRHRQRKGERQPQPGGQRLQRLARSAWPTPRTVSSESLPNGLSTFARRDPIYTSTTFERRSNARSQRASSNTEREGTFPGRRMKSSSRANSLTERSSSRSPRHARRADGSRRRSPTSTMVGRSLGIRRTRARNRASSSSNEKGLTR